MPTYISLGNLTDQGIRNVKEVRTRAQRAEATRVAESRSRGPAIARRPRPTPNHSGLVQGRVEVP